MTDIPDFWRRPFRVMRFDLRPTDARGLDPRRLVSQTLEYGANVMLVNAGGVVAWYPSRLAHHPVNEYMRGDLLGALLREAHRQGLKVLARLDLSVNRAELYEERPEWFQVTARGEVRHSGGMILTCFQSPYWQEHGLALVDEIMANCAVDGLFFDRFRYGYCVCDTCRSVFREETGLDLPLQEDWDDPAWRRLVRFRYDEVAGYHARLCAFIHKRNPRAILAVGTRLTDDDPRSLREAGWLGPRMAKVVDVITLEAFNPLERPSPSYYLYPGEQARMGRSFAQNRPVCVMLTHSEILASRRAAQPPARLTYDLAQIAAHGGQPCVAFSGTFEQDDRKALPAIRRLYHYLRDNASSYQDLRSPARVALVYSQTSMDFYGRDDARGRSLAEYRGFYEALVESHVQFHLLHDACLDAVGLSGYDLVILPNVAALSDVQGAVLDAYVKSGGHLVATHETGLYDEEGMARGAPALTCLGRRTVERLEATGGHLRIVDGGLLPGFSQTDLLAMNEAFWVTAPMDNAASQITDLYLIPPVQGNTPEHACCEEETRTPGLVLNPCGSGEAAYLPWAVGKLYHLYGVPEYKRLIVGLVRRWVAPLLTTDAPGSVEVTLYHARGDRNRALVHFLNATGWQSKPLTQVIPLRDVSVWARGPYVAARELSSGQDLPVTQEDGGARFLVPRLESFAAIELVTAGVAFQERE